MNEDPSAKAAPFILFFRNTGPENFQHLSADQRQQLVGRWNAWYDRLLEQGKALDGQPLELETRLLSGPGGRRVVDGPFPEAKEAIGGYVVLQVADFDEATAIAQQHPAFDYGLQIEIRQMVSHCHLGVKVRTAAARQPAGV